MNRVNRIKQQAEIDTQNEEVYRERFTSPRATIQKCDGIAMRAEQLGYLRGLGYALRTRGAVRCLVSELTQAEDDLTRAAHVFTQLDDANGEAHVSLWLGNLDSRRAGPIRAIERFLVVLDQFRRSGDIEGEISTLHMLFIAFRRLSDPIRALHYASEAKRLAEMISDPLHVALAMMNIGVAASEEENYEQDYLAFAEARARFLQIGDLTNGAIATGNMGAALRRMGRNDEALVHLKECLAVLHEQQLYNYQIAALDEISEALQASGDLNGALQVSRSSVHLAASSGERARGVFAQVRMGELLLLRGEASDAERVLFDALEEACALGVADAEPTVYRALSTLYEARRDFAQALEYHKKYHKRQADARAAEAKSRREDRIALEKLERVRRDAEHQAVKAELQVLKAQMQPHFLFNALNSLAALVETDSAAAGTMLLQLANLLRMALRQSSTPTVPLHEELEFVRRYVSIEQVRREGLIELTECIDPSVRNFHVPHMILQPLVENSIHHGASGDSSHLQIRMSAHVAPEGMLTIEVEDNGLGLPDGWRMDRSGVGLRNTQSRMRILFGSQQRFQVQPSSTGGTVVRLQMPHGLNPDGVNSRELPT